ncbi:MAG: hypothetical protein FJ218_07900 [Ignavibacteria bacterium]|nr:hypothetical protein [Ignavibacteria bacterium]
MNISEETEQRILQLETYANRKLSFKEELSHLLELSARFKQEKQLSETVFSAKAIWNIFSLMQKNSPSVDGFEKLEKEFQEQLHSMLQSLKLLLENAPQEIRESFATKFFCQTQESFVDFLQLCSDLRLLKNLMLDTKTSSQTQ